MISVSFLIQNISGLYFFYLFAAFHEELQQCSAENQVKLYLMRSYSIYNSNIKLREIITSSKDLLCKLRDTVSEFH